MSLESIYNSCFARIKIAVGFHPFKNYHYVKHIGSCLN